MKKAIIMLAAMVLLAAPAWADYAAGTVNVTRVNGDWSGNGGEFTLYGSILDTSAYSALARDKYDSPNSFQTFCVETHEYIMPPYTANVVVSTTFINESTGVVTGLGTHAIKGSLGFGDNLGPQTAWLYTQFAKGVLANYNYTNASGGMYATRAASAGALQNAIWYFEGEGGNPGNTFVTQANSAVTAGWSGIGDVRVLNLYGLGGTQVPYGGYAQDQLYLVPAPAAIGLGLIGLGLVGWVKRRLA